MAGVSNERYEELWQILEKQNGRAYTFEEAKEIGDWLIEFFNLLIELEKDNQADIDPSNNLTSSLIPESCISYHAHLKKLIMSQGRFAKT